ncbi:hypothetical protein PMAG_a1446 [Pseudoalteromonas mariniglutinosa NCIMB 1770]|uniref:Ig-like domain-containing protein n=1 Tax=Pseudoalteromonas mariniglutinosa TaxID=206042 RepID=UPI001F384FB9|nr:Ig-like domain-containing protein [Pseudoalteromonas mariniglutinosa]MCF6144605.1 hypothetical protein [Pseudoalteromonas mariniglutinosa NCIMB 1770]
MDANQLLIIDIQGSVGIVLEDGSIKALSLGDTITVGDIVITAANSSLLIDVKGISLAIPANQRVQITPDLVADAARDSSETTIFDDSIDDAIASLNQPDPTSTTEASSLTDNVSDFLNALESGGDILDNLEATAAGGNAAAGSGGGTSFVELARIAESVDPNSLSFDDSFEASNDGIFAVRDTTDGVLPETALIGSLALNELGLINNPQPVISGTSSNLAGETVLITITDALDNVQTITVIVQPDGTFTSPTIEPLPDGPIVVDVTVTGPDGEPVSDTITANIDTTAPLVSIATLTDSASPVVTITGSVVGLDTGDDVVLTVTDSAGQVQTFITQLDPQGNWAITTAALAEGPYNVQANVVDDAGNEGNAQATATIDLTAPIIAIDVIADTNDVTPTLTGSVNGVAIGTLVSITVVASNGATQTLTATVTAGGSWSTEVTGTLVEGEFTVTATVADSAGNTASATEVGLIDTTAPIITINALAQSNDTTPTISGTTLGVNAGTTVTLVITDSNGDQQTLTTVTDAAGNWQLEPSIALAEGDYTVAASVSDEAGNSSTATTTGNIDLTPPLISINAIADTNDQTPDISGVSQGLSAGSNVTVTVTDSTGAVQVFNTITASDGSWSVSVVNTLAQGQFNVIAQTQDTAGNSAQDSAIGNVDITAPIINIDAFADSNDTTPVITGTVSGVDIGSTITVTVVDNNGVQQILTAVVNTTNTWQVELTTALAEGEFTITATVSDNAGNQASDTSDGLIDITAPLINLDTLVDSADDTPIITGQVQGVANGTLVAIVVVDANGVQQTFATQTLNDGSFAVEVPNSLAQGQYSVVATVADTAGNQASDSTTGLIDLSLLSININIVGETNDTTPELTGNTLNAAAGDQVQVIITDINGQTETLLTSVDANGNWSVTPSLDLAEGEFSVTAMVTDSFGNTANAAITGIVDTTAPIILIDTVGDINDATPVISGTSQGAASGSIVTVVVTDSQNNSQIYSASTDANGNWSFAVTTPVAIGEFTITASVTDDAGNTGTDTELGAFDNTSPVLTLDFDQLTSDTTPLISGTSDTDTGSVVTVLVTDSSGITQTLLAVVGADGSWSISPDNALSDGDFTVTASVADTFGNQSTVSDTGVVDATAPTLTIDNLGTVNDTTPTISGQTSEPVGSVVNLVVNDGANSQNLTAIVNGDGSWSVEVPTALQNGTIAVVANITDAAGNQATANSSFILNDNAPSLSIDAIADSNDVTPTISGASDAPDGSIITVVITDSNNSNQTLTTTVTAGVWSVEAQNTVAEGQFTVAASVTVDGLTSDAQAIGVIDTQAPVFDINPLAETSDTTPTITGSSDEIGGIVNLTVTDATGAVQTLTATVLADGTWAVDVPTPLAEGAFQVDASVTDAAGNIASDTENGGVIDTQAPSFDIDPLAATSDTTPTITGSSDEIGGIVTIAVTDANGAVQTLTATVLADGTWAVDVPTPLAEGAFQVDASITDAAGNTASDTENGGVIDTQAPSFDIDPLAATSDTTPAITGSSDEIGGIVNLTVTDATGAVQTLTATVLADGTWAVDVPTPLAEGAFQVDASITDAAGNTATDSENGGVIDTQAPSFDIDPLAATSDTTPTITGSSDEIGGIVNLTVTDATGAVQTLTATVLADGTWAVDVLTPLAEGAFQVDASITDAAGNTATDSENGGVIDTQAPSFDIDPLADTSDTTPTITGSSDEIGGIVTIAVTDANGAVQTLTATVLADGTWSVDVPTPLAEGAFQVDASITDAAGNTASDSENGGGIDTQAPRFDIDPLAATSDTTPTITGSSDEIGGIVTIAVTDANGAVQTLTATVLADGTWSVDVPTPLAEGAFQVDANITDAAGNTASDSENGGVIDTQAPSFDIDPLAATSDTTPTITGSSDEIGGTVTIAVTDANGTVQNLTATVLADGTWSVDVPTPLAEGAFQVDASVTDAAGNTATDSENGGVIDTQAPSFDIDPLADTSDTTPTITGSSDEIGGIVNLTVTDANGAVQTLTATVLADGTWSVDVPTPLAEGAFQVDASVTDAAGNTASDTENGGVVDTQAPTVSIDAPTLTNDNTPVVTGTSDLANSDIAITFSDSNGSHTVTVQTDGSGNWSAEAAQPLLDGAYTVTATLSDAAGNTGSATDNGVVDTIPPELAFVPTFLLGQLVTLNGTSDLPAGSTVTVTQNLLGGGVINYTATTDAAGNWSLAGLSIPLLTLSSITASASDEAGNIRTINSTDFDSTPPTLTVSVDTLSNDNTPAISGTTDAGQGASVTVVVTDKDGNSEVLTATVDASGDWVISPTTPLADGGFTVDVSVRDGVGNEATESVSGVIDTVAPTLTVQGVGDGKDVTPVFSGTSNEVGGKVILTVTDANGVEQTLEATVGADNRWSVEVRNGLAEGDYTVVAVITDDAGNETSLSLTGNIDTLVPVLTVNDNGLGNDATPSISGSSTEPENTLVNVIITDSNGDNYSLIAVVQAGGSWQVVAPSLPDGGYTVNASITDAAGNTGSASGSGNIDTQAPLLTINNLGTINDATPSINGSSSEPQGTIINLVVTDSSGNDTVLSATVDASGNWSVTAPTLAEDDYTVSATVSDTAGNTTTAQSSFTLNTTAPSIAINEIGNTNDATPIISGTSNAPDNTLVTVTIDDGVNAPEILTAQVLAGVWSVTATQPLAEGDFTVRADVTVVGNTGTANTQGVIDTIAPVIEINQLAETNDTTPTISGTTDARAGAQVTLVITDANGANQTVTTTVKANGTWSISATTALAEGSFVVVASVTDAAGNTGSDTENGGLIDTQAPSFDIDPLAATSDTTPTITGSSDEIGGVVNLTVTDATGAVQILTATVLADGSWAVDVPTPLAEGAFQVDASITDAAGNTATDSENGGVVDTQAPTVTIDAPTLTNDNTPVVTGTSDLANSDIAITFSDSNGSHTVTVQTDGSGHWSAEAAQPLLDGAYTVTASLSDAAGNTGSATDNGVVDTIPPALAFVPTFLLGQLVTLNGTSDLPAGSTVTVTQNLLGGGVVNYTATTDAAGNWSLLGLSIPLLTLSSITASASDEAGNIRTINSTDFDGTPPTLTVNVDTLSNDNTPEVSGTTDAGQGAAVTVLVTDKDGNTQTVTAIVDANGEWAISPNRQCQR